MRRISKRKKERLPLRLTTISEDLLFSQSNQPLRYLNLYNQVGYRNSYYPITSFLFILVTSENYPSSVISIYIRSQLSRLALRTSAFNPVAARFPPNHVTNGPPGSSFFAKLLPVCEIETSLRTCTPINIPKRVVSRFRFLRYRKKLFKHQNS